MSYLYEVNDIKYIRIIALIILSPILISPALSNPIPMLRYANEFDSNDIGSTNLDMNCRQLSSGSEKEVEWFDFKLDWRPPQKDIYGNLMRGTELMKIISYNDSLFAGTGTWLSDFENDLQEGTYTGAQVLRKDNPTDPWMVDVSFGERYLRVDTLIVATFTMNYQGIMLDEPVQLLVAGIWDIGGISDIGGDKYATISVREDSGTWTIIPVGEPSIQETFASVRSMIVHQDQETGQEYLFVNAACGGVYKFAYDQEAVGMLRQIGADELPSSDKPNGYGRPQSTCIVDNVLHVAFGYGNTNLPDQQGGLYRRIDGSIPTWELVYSWSPPWPSQYERLLRGISAVEGPNGNMVIIGALEKPPEPVIKRIDPLLDYQVVDEVNYNDFFSDKLGGEVNTETMNGAIINTLIPFIHPDTGKDVHLVTTWVMHPNIEFPEKDLFGYAYYMVRYPNATYNWGCVSVPEDIVYGIPLQGLRTIAQSPWDSETYYFGGYAKTRADLGDTNSDTAWIYKATLTDNKRPMAPLIVGPDHAKKGEECSYVISSIDPNDDNLYYFIDWGDEETSGWLGPYSSGKEIVINHSWNKNGWYNLYVMAKDENNAGSYWSQIEVSMSKGKPFNFDNTFFYRFFIDFWSIDVDEKKEAFV